jgi:hypothetical protein
MTLGEHSPTAGLCSAVQKTKIRLILPDPQNPFETSYVTCLRNPFENSHLIRRLE